jgi:dienelactone hydrolase
MSRFRLLPVLAAGLALCSAAAWAADSERSQIRNALFIPDPLPPLAAETHGRFRPAAGVMAERVTYASQFGLRVPAILYLPEPRREKVPALIVVNGHGGDKYSWYAFYAGILYARGGAAVLTYDPIGEGERHRERRSGTRAHDQNLAPREMGQRLGGLLVTDVMQAVAYLRSRPEVDPGRIGAMGYSLGSFVTAVAGAAEPRLHACVLAGGGNLDGPDGYWDRSKPMCQGIPYQSLRFLGDRPAALYALHAARGPTLIVNGLADSVVGIPRHGHGEAFFQDLQERTARRKGNREGVFEFQLLPEVSHRPFFVTRPVALWLERHLDFPNWTEATVRSLPETHISRWATAYGVALDPLYASEEREGGTRALGEDVPALSRAALSVFRPDEWEREKGRLVYESWVEAARARVQEGP